MSVVGGPNNFVRCCLIDVEKCQNLASTSHFSKRVERVVREAKLHVTVDQNALHLYICEHHKDIIKKARDSIKRRKEEAKRALQERHEAHMKELERIKQNRQLHKIRQKMMMKPKSSIPVNSPITPSSPLELDLSTLSIQSLYRYKRIMAVQSNTGLTKQQLAKHMTEHLQTIRVNEKEVISYFLYMLKTGSNKLDSSREERNGHQKATYLSRPKMTLFTKWPSCCKKQDSHVGNSDDDSRIQGICEPNSPQL